MSSTEPTSWLVMHQQIVPAAGRALDIACGRGRNALWLAARGLETTAIDRDESAIVFLESEARARQLPLTARVLDLETGSVDLGTGAYALIVVVHYLHRPLFPALKGALAPGGLLVYETFTLAHRERGRPTNPAFLLAPGELRDLVQPFEIVVEREGEFEGKMLASVIARRP